MKSDWRVISNRVNGDKVYQVYRLYDRRKVMHSGNMEFSGIVFETEKAAKEYAKQLNKQDE